MATKLGVNATKIAASIPQLAEQGEQKGRVKVLYDEYALTADLAVNDVIKMGGLLPAGARVMEVVCDSPDLDSASAGALTVGWAASADAVEAADDDGFLTTIDVHTAGKTLSMSSLLCSAAPGKFKKFASPVQVQVKVSGETDATSGTIRCAVFYIVD
jgi:hypothetical protein